MIELTTLAIFIAACFAIAITPGPDMLLIASRSMAQGKAAGFATYAGTAVGIFIHALAAALGLAQLFISLPWAYDAVRYAGAAYLLYLAWKTVSSTNEKAPSSNQKFYSHTQMFTQGLLTNLLNPKIILFILALFPQFIDPEIGSVAAQIMVLVLVFNSIGLIVLSVVIFTAQNIANRMSRAVSNNNRRFAHLPQYLLATVFTSLAVRLIFSQR